VIKPAFQHNLQGTTFDKINIIGLPYAAQHLPLFYRGEVDTVDDADRPHLPSFEGLSALIPVLVWDTVLLAPLNCIFLFAK